MSIVRDALTPLGRSPGFTGLCLAVLGLGIGAAVTVFSVVDGVLLRPLPYPEPERLVAIQQTLLPRFPEVAVAPVYYDAWRREARGFAGLGAWHEGAYNLTGRGEPVRLAAGRITASLLPTLGVSPLLGRGFVPAEDQPARAQVVLLGHGFWRRALGGRAEVLGETIQLDGRPFTVVGVLPPWFQLDGPLDVYTPAAYDMNSGVHDIRALGRLGPGVTGAAAQAELGAITARLSDEYPRWGARVDPLAAFSVREVRRVLLLLAGAVGFLLAITCANVAGLVLARASGRVRELAVRAALGATPGRIGRQVLAEALALATGGGVLGVLAASWGTTALLALAPEAEGGGSALPRAQLVGLDVRVLVFACLLVAVTGLVAGLLPALRAGRADPATGLREQGRGIGVGGRSQRLRAGLVVAELAAAVVLLVGAGLLGRSFTRLQRVDAGFRPEGATAFTLAVPVSKYPHGSQMAAFATRVVDQLGALPGVAAAGAVQGLPFSGNMDMAFFKIAGRPPVHDAPLTKIFMITPGYLQAMGIPLLRGRAFDGRDGADAPRVTLINQTMARTVFGGQDPIGQRVTAIGSPEERWHEIVGVVGDVRPDQPGEDVPLQAYAPLAQNPADWGAFTFAVRAPRNAGGPTAGALRAAVQVVDPEQAVTRVQPLGVWLAGALARQRFALLVFTLFSGAALLLAALGVYGVMAQAVSQRTGEIGVRRALGAGTPRVLGLVLGRAGKLVAAGLALGVVGAVALGRLLGGLLYDVSPHDPITFIGIAALLAVTAAVACLVPARRALAVDPALVLRQE